MKKSWRRPKLTVLARGRSDEYVLDGCKTSAGGAGGAESSNHGCRKIAGCGVCKLTGS